MHDGEIKISPELLLDAYSQGLFPMAESANAGELLWFDPRQRGILPLDQFHIPRRLRRSMRNNRLELRADTDFDAVLDACAAPGPGREGTWINREIRSLYKTLFERGWCHTIEVYDQDELVGGLYGVAIGAAFFGESMFHRKTDASKYALVHLVARLKAGGYELLDTQFLTEHLTQFGAREIPRSHYRRLLESAIEKPGEFHSVPTSTWSDEALQLVSQTS